MCWDCCKPLSITRVFTLTRNASAGSFTRPLFAEDRTTCNGVETKDGTKYYADKVVLATGAWSPALIGLEDQCVSKAWAFAYIQLTPQEVAEYKDVPAIYDGGYGFFFEPNEHGIIKLCDEFPGFSRFKWHQPYVAAVPKHISVPWSHAKHPTDTYPDASELLNRSMRWCTDTADANLLICEHPKWKNFILATGDSGNSFKLLPNIGKQVVELMEGPLPQDLADPWRWRTAGDTLKSRRAALAKNLADMPGWKNDVK
ncbi:FAD dependent oxidoreductase-domain-containing protein [Dactylonectria estremocensis]|uniref:FAD dependent oxidoreductase-domain-containing protein n=1 Tax=Dactylonectria estremocensis TaxID=1079267 RepID=A0A9P9DK38_9HYPO|nr:FAD dependent oxidoreductase-domain-containing protein [Dactylonectria estremocensis]